jgi:hypothetical protein
MNDRVTKELNDLWNRIAAENPPDAPEDLIGTQWLREVRKDPEMIRRVVGNFAELVRKEDPALWRRLREAMKDPEKFLGLLGDKIARRWKAELQ